MKKSALQTDQNAVVVGLLNRDGRVIEDVRKIVRPSIVKLARKLKRTPDYAESVINEGIANLIVNLENNKFREESNLYTYLYSICHNLMLMEERKNDFLNNYRKKSNKEENQGSEQITETGGRRESLFEDYDANSQEETNSIYIKEGEEDIDNAQEDTLFPYSHEDDRYEFPQEIETISQPDVNEQLAKSNGFEIDGELLFKAFSKLGSKCKKFILLELQRLPDKIIAQKLGYKSVGSVYNLRLTCRENAIERFAEEDRNFRKPFHFVETDIFTIDKYNSGRLTNKQKEIFLRRLKTDDNLLYEYHFIHALNKAAKKYRMNSLVLDIKAIKEENINRKSKTSAVAPIIIDNPMRTLQGDDGQTYCSVDDMIKNLYIEKSIIENNGENVPSELLFSIERLKEIQEDIKRGIFERFDL